MEQRRRRFGPPELTFRGRPVFYGWWVVGGSFLLTSLGGGFYIHGFSPFISPLAEQFDVGLGTVALVFAAATGSEAVFGPLLGYLIDRFGSRRMMLVGIPMFAAGFFLLSLAPSPPFRLPRLSARDCSRRESRRLHARNHGSESLVPPAPGHRALDSDGGPRRRRPLRIGPPVLDRRVRLADRRPRRRRRDPRGRLSHRAPGNARPAPGNRGGARWGAVPRGAGRRALRPQCRLHAARGLGVGGVLEARPLVRAAHVRRRLHLDSLHTADRAEGLLGGPGGGPAGHLRRGRDPLPAQPRLARRPRTQEPARRRPRPRAVGRPWQSCSPRRSSGISSPSRSSTPSPGAAAGPT